MYLHLGQGIVVRHESIVGVCDLDNSSASHITREFLYRAEKEGRVVNLSEALPKSFVLCEEKGKTLVYLSQIAPSTLLRRSEAQIILE